MPTPSPSGKFQFIKYIYPEEKYNFMRDSKVVERRDKSMKFLATKCGIRFHDGYGTDGPTQISFDDETITAFLDKYEDGLMALKDLSYLVHLKAITWIHYSGDNVNTWVRNNNEKFNLDEDDMSNLEWHSYVFVNHYYCREWGDNEMNDYFLNGLEGTKDKHKDNMAWFWGREF